MSQFPLTRNTGLFTAYNNTPLYVQGCVDRNACKLKVEGKGSVRVRPDIANITIGVTTESKQLEIAQRENSEKIAEIVDAIINLGVAQEDIKTQSYNIDPQYDFIDGKQVFRAFRVSHSLRVTVRNISEVGRIIDAAVENGANVVNNIEFSVSDPSRYYQQALRAAIDDAATKAVTIGERLRVSVSRIPVQVVEEEYQYAIPYQATLFQAQGGGVPIQSGQIEINAKIEAIFTYYPA